MTFYDIFKKEFPLLNKYLGSEEYTVVFDKPTKLSFIANYKNDQLNYNEKGPINI